MNTAANILPLSPSENILPLPSVRKVKAAPQVQRFKIKEFTNPRTDSKSWRVDGIQRDGTRIRENFSELQAAQCRQLELETEFLQGHQETTIRATKLTQEQIQLAEVAFIKLGDDWQRILDAVDHWRRTGQRMVSAEAPRIDDAVDQYLAWLAASSLRDATKRHWRIRMNTFKNSVQNVRVSEISPEFVEKFLSSRNTTAGGKDTDRRALSRFLSWCLERPRRWMISNPCREVKIDQGEKAPPSILSLTECRGILRATESHKGGMLAPYVAVCLFGGLRPFETARLQWSSVNLKDNEIRLEGNQTKTGQGRVVEINDTLRKWLKAHQGKPFFPANWRKEFDAVKMAAGFGTPDPDDEKRATLKPWPDDVLRHTAISHHFRLHNSYGKAAEQFGNSEAIIKKHYQSRVSSDETKQFFALVPGKLRKQSRNRSILESVPQKG